MTVIAIQQAASADARQEQASSGTGGGTTAINVWQYNNTSFVYHGGVWWDGITVPSGATIDAADFEFYLSSYDDPHCAVYMEDVDDAANWDGTLYELANKTRTTASLSIAEVARYSAGWNNEDITSLAAEVFGRGGWSSGNAAAILWIGNVSAGPDLQRFRWSNGGSFRPYLNVTYTGGGSPVSITVNSATHSHAAGGTSVSQSHEISTNGSLHSHAADNTTITQSVPVAPGESSHAHSADSPAVSQTHQIAVSDADHTHAADNTTISQAHPISVNDAIHSHAADSTAITQTHLITVSDAIHAHIADNTTIAQTVSIDAADASHAHIADESSVTQTHFIIVADTAHAHVADETTVTQSHEVNTSDARHAHAADNSTVTQTHVISVGEATHGHVADGTTVTQFHAIVTADAIHSHTADSTTIAQGVPITPNDADHSHAADPTSITQAHQIAVAGSIHGHTVDEPSVTQTHLIVVAGAVHSHAADNVSLTQAVTVVVVGGLHAHAADATTVELINLVCTVELSPTSASTELGGSAGSWINESNILAEDGSAATTDGAMSFGYSDGLVATWSAEDILAVMPAGSVLYGIAVTVREKTDISLSAARSYQLRHDGKLVGDKHDGFIGTKYTDYVMGGSGDLVGTTLTASELTTDGLDLVIKIRALQPPVTPSIDHVSLVLCYEVAAVSGPYCVAAMGIVDPVATQGLIDAASTLSIVQPTAGQGLVDPAAALGIIQPSAEQGIYCDDD